ncbi:insulinase family protein [Desulfonema ishimotonii]|uniref:Insulinase family protein n=1 Tax=Desulfonema ishimotonii TaxID=45657 RepID=A0A401G3V0_9BACT|nr:insulinase family protein [Desulfonema ishimotonii]GBC63917.1 insulinase family protein [Desulfonema ishimotonii]
MSSRIFQEIRERRGLAYSVYSFMSSYTDTGVSGVYVGTGPDNGAESVRLILRALRRLREMPVDADELRDAREYTKGNMMLASESVDNQMVRLARDEIHLGRYMPLDDIVSQVEAVTADDILRLAQELYRPDPLTLTILGPVTDAAPYAALLEEF